MKKNYCQNCGLMYRDWIHKAELTVCDECDPEKFATLHKQNIRRIKRRTIGQEHITEHTFFPKYISSNFKINWQKPKWYSRKQK